MTGPIRIGLVGFGKIARDEHLPAIAATGFAELAAVASRNTGPDAVPNYPDLDTMLAAQPDLDAIVLCQPPQARFAAARKALTAGKHVFLEKPPGATVSEVEILFQLAEQKGVALYASWHSRYASPVARLKEWIAARPITSVAIEWKEDVRLWHPGQDWIWEAGGFGVFDPGINALSILTEVMPESIRLVDAVLTVPTNRAAPIAADLILQTASGVPVSCAFDWRQTGPQIWEIRVQTADDGFTFSQSGDDAASTANNGDSALGAEYRAMYRRFVELVLARKCEADLAPLQLVADAFLRGRMLATEPFEF